MPMAIKKGSFRIYGLMANKMSEVSDTLLFNILFTILKAIAFNIQQILLLVYTFIYIYV